MSAYPAEGMADTLIGNLSLVGTVLYQRHLSFTNSIGVVLQMMDKIKSEPNDSAVPAIAPPNSQCLPGNWQENQIAVRAVPNIPVSGASSGGTVSIVTARSTTVGYQQLIGNLGNLRLKSESPYPYQRPQISAFQARESGPYGRNARRYRGLSGYINNSSTIGRFSPYQVPVKEERVAQRPSPKDEHPSDNPTVKEEYPESSSD